jgi:glutamate/tyrosine decarboxylase-like PLP-dependent enzyme
MAGPHSNTPPYTTEEKLMQDADERAADYLRTLNTRPVFPDTAQLQTLDVFDENIPSAPTEPADMLALLDDVGSPNTVVSTGPHYYGFVIGGLLPGAAAAERMINVWDQCASSHINSPIAAKLEEVAGRWVLDILDLPRSSAVGFGTSAAACGLSCFAAARRELLARHGWDLDQQGLIGAPEIKVVVSDISHITIFKALRILGFGTQQILKAPTDAHGRIDPDTLPPLDDKTILCLQAGEVNTGNFDPFDILIPRAQKAGAWVHVDGAFGLWARATNTHRDLTTGIELADSWTTDGHKWLNTAYDSAMAIVKDGDAFARAMNADAVYSTAETYAQKNLTLEFSRRPRGISIWAALKTLGRSGVCDMVERHCAQARRLAQGIDGKNGIRVLNTVSLNQVLCTAEGSEDVAAFTARMQDSGKIWFGTTVWQGKPAFRLSVSNWRTTDADIDRAIAILCDR